MTQPAQPEHERADAWLLDGGPADVFTPRDLFRAMVIARSLGEHGTAERLRVALLEAFQAAGLPVPTCAEAISYPLQ